MKIITKLFFLILLLSGNFSNVFALQEDTSLNAKKKECLQKLITGLNGIDWFSNSLSVKISTLKRAQIDDDAVSIINTNLDSIKRTYNIFSNSIPELNQFLKETDSLNYQEQILNFKVRHDMMLSRVEALLKKANYPIYAVQIDYIENSVTSFINTTANFKLYLQSLYPPIPDTLFPRISERVDKTDNLLKTAAGQLTGEIDATTSDLAKSVKKVDEKEDTALGLLRPKAGIRNILGFVTYSADLFGLKYLFLSGKPQAKKISTYFGAEPLLPIASPIAKNIGGFVVYGLSTGHEIIVESGLGYLKTTRNAESMSWKFAVTYCPGNIGIGFTYSPLTGEGLQMIYRW